MKFEFSLQIFEKKKNFDIRFHQNAFRGSRVVPCGRTGVTKPIAAFRNFAYAPKNWRTVSGRRGDWRKKAEEAVARKWAEDP